MALIKCPECGKEISDKAVACINCGCPVSAMNIQSAEPAKPAETAKPAAKTVDLGATFGQFFGNQTAVKTAPIKTAPVKTVPTELPEMKMFPGIIVAILEKFSGMAGLAGFTALGAVVCGLLNGFFEKEFINYTILGFAIGFGAIYLKRLMEFRHARKFLKKNGYEESIRNDAPDLTNSINAFKLCRYMIMVWYIKRLNPVAGSVLEKAIKGENAKRRKEKLYALPFLVVLFALYCLIPRYEESANMPYESSLIVCHLWTAVVMLIYGCKKKVSLKMAVIVAVLFAPAIFAYFYSGLWYHIVICAAVALVSMWIGSKMRKK